METGKIIPWIALRNAAGVGIPLLAGIARGELAAGLIMCTGALNVSFSDGKDPYRQRARRMLLASFFCGAAVVIGTMTGGNNIAATIIATAWAFAAGMMVALGTTAADIGTISLVTLVVFGAQPMAPHKAALSGLLAFIGGLVQTLLSIASWPLRRYEPERRALGDLYAGLKRMIEEHVDASEAPPATSQSSDAQKSLSSLTRDYSLNGERYRSLLNQAERARLSILAIKRMRSRMRRESIAKIPETLDVVLRIAADTCGQVSNLLLRTVSPVHAAPELEQLRVVAAGIRAADIPASPGMALDARSQVAALAGQLRSAMALADHAVDVGKQVFDRQEARKPWTLRLTSWVATLRANFSLQSTACRHAIRLAICIAIGDSVGRGMGWLRPYWIPMTIAIVLKPDFSSTFSRGLLRLAGTYAGLVLATGLFDLVSPTLPLHISLIIMVTFLLRAFGPVNYGFLTAAVSALVVLLIALTGISPKVVINARAINTTYGGVLALIAYAVWPTWELRQLPETIADLLSAYRNYFHALTQAYLDVSNNFEELERCRLDGRLARSNLEASIDRYRVEPGASAERLDGLLSIMASSHRFIHAAMSLEADLGVRKTVSPPTFRSFADDVDRTLEMVVSALRTRRAPDTDFPDLREDHTQLVQSAVAPDTLLATETDRITNSLNTLREQIMQWAALR